MRKKSTVEKSLEILIHERKKKLEEIRKIDINPYAHKFDRSHSIQTIQEKHSKIKADQKLKKAKVAIAGRIRSIRRHGGGSFADIEDFTGKIQIWITQDIVGEKIYNLFEKIDIGDIVGIKGFIFKTKRGELSIWVEEFTLLTKSLRPLPSSWYGLKDVETRYRQRYVDLIMNPEVRKTFEIRGKVIEAMREFLISKGFVEVETPILQPKYGGASARPFESYLNALDMKVYMRISNELYLKRLIVGGYEKVFEFSIDFRNEGVDTTHNPEFTQMETMWAYANYKDNMTFCEEMFEYIAKKVLGTTKINYQGKDIDLKVPWQRIRMFDAIKKYTQVDFDKVKIFEEAKKIAEELEIDVSGCDSIGEIAMKVFEENAQPNLIQPTIVYDYPAEVFILAKISEGDNRFAEAFEPIINGIEIGLSYSEENDPEKLKNYWRMAEERFKKGKVEAQRMDFDFLRALEYGMPPTSGLGIGVDRAVMLFTNSASIRDVIFFPVLRPETPGKEKKSS